MSLFDVTDNFPYEMFVAEEEQALQDFAATLPSLDSSMAVLSELPTQEPKKRRTTVKDGAAVQPKKKRTPKEIPAVEEVVLSSGMIIPNEDLLLPYTEEELATVLPPAQYCPPPVRKNKRKRVPEFDPQSGEWTDVRRFDRMPVTIEEAEEGERVNRVPHGAYFVSLAHKRITGIIQLHARWLAKTKNQCSDYAEVQRNLMEFFSGMLEQFNHRYAIHTTHPQFESIGKTRKRQQKEKSPSA